MKPQAKQSQTFSALKNTTAARVLDLPAEGVEVRELSLDELAQVGGGGVKDHSV